MPINHQNPTGTFKQQHDTGQNAKVVIVYPRVACASSGSKGGAGDPGTTAAQVDSKSPEYMACSADLESFKAKVAQKVTSWRQCKRLLKLLQENNEQVSVNGGGRCEPVK